jgi:hypothetical protein
MIPVRLEATPITPPVAAGAGSGAASRVCVRLDELDSRPDVEEPDVDEEDPELDVEVLDEASLPPPEELLEDEEGADSVSVETGSGSGWGSGSGSGSGSGAGGSTPTKPVVPKDGFSITGVAFGATAGTTGRSCGVTTEGICSAIRSTTDSEPVVLSAATAATSSPTPWGLACAGTAAAASRPPEVAATAVAFAERDIAMLDTVNLLGARWRPFVRCDTVNLCLAYGMASRTTGDKAPVIDLPEKADRRVARWSRE